MSKVITEGLRIGDLKGMVDSHCTIDEYTSKMGDDHDIIVISFKVQDQAPALDLVDFIEKGYDFVLDGDATSTELDDGKYMVFVEVERTPKFVNQLLNMLAEMENLTENKGSEFTFSYGKKAQKHPCDYQNLSRLVPLTTDQYKRRYGKTEIDEMKTAANIPVDTKAPVNDYTESLRVAAGIK
jgi:hypothetical protein